MGGGWVVDKTKIMLIQLQTEVELKSELSLATIWSSTMSGVSLDQLNKEN